MSTNKVTTDVVTDLAITSAKLAANAVTLGKINPGAGITLATEQASTSGTSIDFTGIPAGVKRITINLVGVSTNGADPLYVRLGDSGGIEASGYLSSAGGGSNGGTIITGLGLSSFLIVPTMAAASAYSGSVILSLENASTNMWVAHGIVIRTDSGAVWFSAGHKATSAVLDRVRVTTSNGIDTFDAGVINIGYE